MLVYDYNGDYVEASKAINFISDKCKQDPETKQEVFDYMWEMMHEEPELLKGALYNYFIIDSIQVILGDISKKEKEQIIKKMMMDDAFCEDFVKIVDKLVGKDYE